jgi:hypothetical protein
MLARSVTTGRTGRQVVGSRGQPDAPRGPSTWAVEHNSRTSCTATTKATPASSGRRHVFVVEIPARVLQQQAHHDLQESHSCVSRRCYRLSQQAIARLHTEAFGVLVSGVARSLDKLRVSGVAVTRHAVVVSPTIQVRTVDVD